MKTIHFTKMQGCGNDFVILDFEEYRKSRLFMGELARRLCASIGEHTHTDNCEMFYVFKGSIKAICDGVEECITAGNLHYCPQGHTHTLINDTDMDVLYLSVIPRQ